MTCLLLCIGLQAELAPQLAAGLGQPLFPASELARGLGRVISKAAVNPAAGSHTQAVMVTNIAALSRPDGEESWVAGKAEDFTGRESIPVYLVFTIETFLVN